MAVKNVFEAMSDNELDLFDDISTRSRVNHPREKILKSNFRVEAWKNTNTSASLQDYYSRKYSIRLPNNVKIINAEGKKFQVILTEVKSLLLGKCKPTYIANTDGGDYVIIINSKKIIFNHQKYNSYFGLIKYQKVKYIIENDTEKLYRLALRNLLPKTSLGRRILKKLKVYKEDIEDIDDLKKFILNAEINKTQELSLKRKSCP